MTNSPVFNQNSPASNTRYLGNNSGYWYVPNSGTTVDTYVSSYAGANGSGGLVTVGTLVAVNDNPIPAFIASQFAANGANTAHVSSSSGTNGSTVFAAAVYFYNGGSPGSLQCYSAYTGNPCLPYNLSLSTGAATEGSTISIFGNYVDGVTSIVFPGGVGAGFSIVNAGDGNRNNGQINVTVPSNAQNGQIQLNTPNGSAYTGNFLIVPNITGWSASSAHVGDTISLFGSGFLGVTNVAFPPASTSASYSIINDGQINTTVPGAAGHGNISVSTAGGTSSFGTFSTLPTISGYNVSSGTVGTPVTITGTGFTQVTGVNFNNGVAASYTVNSTTQISTTVPSGAVKGGITVFTQSGSVTGATFSVLPNITGFSTSSGHVGDTITINGSGFTGTTAVHFSVGVSASYTVTNDGAISATVPAGAVKGALTVINAGGSTSHGTFLVLPLISGVSPTTAPPGSNVTISGSGFTGTTSVTFYNNVAATSYTVNSDAQITATVPTGSISGPLTVTNASGSASSASLTVSSMHVYRSGAWTQAQNVYVYRSGAWVAAAGVFVYRSGSWVSAG